jgi:hypothetical protein
VLKRNPRRIVSLGDSFHDSEGYGRLMEADRARLTSLQRGRDWIWISGNQAPDLANVWLPKIRTRQYDSSNRPFTEKKGVTVGMGRNGVQLIGFGNTVRNMTVRNCVFGINATGLILDNVVERNGNFGISTFDGVVRNNFVSDNGGVGIFAFRGTVVDNVSQRNASFGFQSLNTDSGSGAPIPHAGFKGNVFSSNNNGGPEIGGGTQLGPNMCGIGLCP